MFGKKTYRHILILGSQVDGIVKAQYEPFVYTKKYLKQLGIKFKFQSLTDSKELLTLNVGDHIDALFIIPFWRETIEDLENGVVHLKTRYPGKKVVFIDPYAQPTSNYFPLLDQVDHFLKRQTYADPSHHRNDYMGGMPFTDYLVKRENYDIGDSYWGSKIPDNKEASIKPGWSLGTAKRFYKLVKKPIPNFSNKTIDVFCRMALGNKSHIDWYSEYRRLSIEKMAGISEQYNCAISGCYNDEGLVPQSQYFKEIKQSRIVVSPFGWGESCWRDYEAVCYGGLLIKPDMGHIASNPDIFIDGETYVSVKWDYSDLEEKCAYYLKNNEERERIVNNAYDVYHRYFSEHKFEYFIESLLTN